MTSVSSRSPRVAIGVAGAPTVVVDASIRACLDELDSGETLGIVGGPEGLLRGTLSTRAFRDLQSGARAGSVLGAGRLAIGPIELERALDVLQRNRVDTLVLVGGNGTMALLAAVEAAAKDAGQALRVVGIPKTIDNDLEGVDAAPGFASAARYVGEAVRGIGLDHRAMSSIEPVRVVETMGRSVGWLAASGAALLAIEEPKLDLAACLVPEDGPIDLSVLYAVVENALAKRGRALILCSEGVSFGETDTVYSRANHSDLLFGGISRHIARSVSDAIGVRARGEVLGTQQRGAASFVAPGDLALARLVGREAGRAARDGQSAVMIGTRRIGDEPLHLESTRIPLLDVAGATRSLEPRFRPSASGGGSLGAWLGPYLVQPRGNLT